MENKHVIRVWDIGIRIGHWALAGCFATALISSENSRNLHVISVYTVFILVLFRILYGFAGAKYARFSNFICAPAQITDNLKRLFTEDPNITLGTTRPLDS
jgi:cytochrome b